jgi:hypothetical protein
MWEGKMSGSNEWEKIGVNAARRTLMRMQTAPMYSWIDLQTGGYCVGRAVEVTSEPRAALVQHWHSGRVEVLGPTAALTLLPYPAEPITEPEVR